MIAAVARFLKCSYRSGFSLAKIRQDFVVGVVTVGRTKHSSEGLPQPLAKGSMATVPDAPTSLLPPNTWHLCISPHAALVRDVCKSAHQEVARRTVCSLGP